MSLDQIFNPVALVLLLALLASLGVIVYLYRQLMQQDSHKYQRPIVKLNLPDPHNVLDFRQVDEDITTDEEIAEEDIDHDPVLTDEVFHKFVPKQFVHHFTKEGTQQLELGQADEDDVAILFCDIRGFTTLSESMSPQELMNFLNSYFLRMSEPIHRHKGFIDKFIGDAIMSLFDHPGGTEQAKSKDALHAAIDLRKTINIYNQHRSNSGYPPIDIGIGIHFGPVILGTIGSHVRMDTTVIGDSVNIAYRLETLTPIYNCDIIVSSQLLDTADARDLYSHRLLDWVRVKGKRNPVEIYEILAHLTDEERKLRLQTAPLIEQGLKARKNQDWDQALKCFREAQSIDLDDKVIRHHLAQCHKMRSEPVPPDWDGSLMM